MGVPDDARVQCPHRQPRLLALVAALAACAGPRTDAPVKPPAAFGNPTSTPPIDGGPVATPPTASGPDEWQPACSAQATCGACMNHGPCQWCAEESRCVGPKTTCGGERVQQPGACYTAPLDVAKRRYPGLAKQLERYQVEREVQVVTLEAGSEASFFLNSGDCFAVLAEPLAPQGQAELGYALRIRGTPRPGDRVALPRSGTGGREARAELSPELCPWEHQPLAIWNAAPKNGPGPFRLHLLQRPHPDPAALAREAQAALPSPPVRAGAGGGGGGSCTSMECREDCESDLRACELDCFRYGSHEPAEAATCKAVCRQIERSCERGCGVPCP